MIIDILKAFCIGICASMPLGPIALLVLQRSMSEGHRTGFFTGLGATTVDTLFAIVAVFALAFAESFIDTHRTVILLAGGAILCMLGLSMTFKDPSKKVKEQTSAFSVKDYLQAVATGLSNPGAVFIMLALFAFFGVDTSGSEFRLAPVILAVSAGSVTYWFCFSYIFSRIGSRLGISWVLWINRIAGVIISLIGVSLLADGVFRLVFDEGLF